MRTIKNQSNHASDRRSFFKHFSLLTAAWPLASYLGSADDQSRPAPAPLLPITDRPEWLREGVVAIWHMEALEFYIRRGYATVRGAGPTDIDQLWKDSFNEATAKRYKDLGINLVEMPLHKGGGLKAEAQSLEATRKFIEIAHRSGIRVLGYIGATIMYETFYSEEPDARNWEQVDERGRPIYYPNQTFRHAACRNNPNYRAFLQKVLRLGIEDLKLDMIEFDQLQWWPEPWSCHCKYCQEGFRAFLKRRYTDEQLKARLGFADLGGIRVPDFNRDAPPILTPELKDPLMQEWAQFRCASLAQWWGETRAYIHKLNPQVALSGNPTWEPAMNAGFIYGVDVQQLFQYCEIPSSEERNGPFWASDDRLVSRFRSYKVARTMGRSLFTMASLSLLKPQLIADIRPGAFEPLANEPRSMQTGPSGGVINWEGLLALGVAEGLAYNDLNPGYWNEEEGEEPTGKVHQYIDFFRSHIQDLVDTTPVADVAILRSFASIEFNPAKSNVSTMLFEQTLFQSKIPFAIIFDPHLQDLSKYKVLVLANQDALSDEQVDRIRRFVQNGGGLVATEETSILTEWRRPRNKFGLADVFDIAAPPADIESAKASRRQFGKGRVVYIPKIKPEVEPPPARMSYDFSNEYWKLPKNYRELVEAVRWTAQGELSASVDAPLWVTMELAEQKSTLTRLLHLVNYKIDEPVKDISVKVAIPAGTRLREVVLESPDGQPRQVLPSSSREGQVSFTVPQLDIYNLVVLRTKRT